MKFQEWEYRARKIIVIKKSYETQFGLPKFALIARQIIVIKKSYETQSGLPKFAKIAKIIVCNNSTIFLV